MYDRVRFENPTAFMPFTNLTCLAMLNLRGRIPPWAKCIANILIASPAMESLSISLSESSFEGTSSLMNCEEILQSFMVDICARYAKEQEPLRLKRLHLDDYIMPPKRQNLELLTDLTVLEEISVYNNCEIEDAEYKIDFSIFSPEISPSLKVISFHELPDEIWQGFAGSCVGTRPIELRFSHHIGDEEETYRFLQDYLGPKIPDRRFPQQHGPTTCPDGNTLEDVDSQEQLTLLGINIRYYNLVRLGKPHYVTNICDTISKLPRLEALWLDGSKTNRTLMESNAWHNSAMELARAGPLLTYIRIHGVPWQACREPELKLIYLDEWDDEEVRPDFFDTEYPSAWANIQR
ncbi:hypothetical protein VHEMI08130 [[Torrubiella] hemipterigena]|uniref:F-box domain-containing protein n=1 Tax=[Torrubiella] hemipterigena TaxID=1531966 RepID=A0A0A1TCG7_9HYPO|nr:hypothetical protein VHEMI08130 [[Torrubiella] hemipterigena]